MSTDAREEGVNLPQKGSRWCPKTEVGMPYTVLESSLDTIVLEGGYPFRKVTVTPKCVSRHMVSFYYVKHGRTREMTIKHMVSPLSATLR